MSEDTDIECATTQDAPDIEIVDLERLGRQRPAIFPSAISEILFCSSLLVSMLMAEYFISGFNIVLPVLADELELPLQSQTWPASVFSLVTGAFLLPLGRVADIYGGSKVFMSGLVWFLVWSIIAGFSKDYKMLIAVRALQGFGPGAFLPTGIMLLGQTYRPGPRKNLVFGLYGAFAPLGFFFGIIMGGVTAELLSWRWYFWLGSIVIFAVCVTSLIAIPKNSSRSQKRDVVMDYWGLLTIVPALILIIYAITDGAHAPHGWKTPYVIVCFLLGLIFLALATYVEGWVSPQPLLPFALFRAKHMKTLVVSLFLVYGAFGIYLFYASFRVTEVMEDSALLAAVAFAPMAGGGIILSTIGGFTLHLLPGRILLIISGLGSLASMLLFAVMPDGASYWAFIFPAMIGATIGVDITYNVSSVFITTNIPQHHQGVAGALINSLVFLGISFFLGIADLIVSEVGSSTNNDIYTAAFWFGAACAGIASLIFVFVGIGKAESQLTIEERARTETA